MDPGFRPVFVAGHHRSGTTILYKLLGETGLFNVTTAYHVLHRGRLLALHAGGREEEARAELAREMEARGLRDREFDSMRVSPDIPEEYAWVLDHQGRRPRLTPANLPGFLRFCREVSATQDPSRPLLLKNPFDAARFLYIRSALPSASFVYIHRNPVEVVNSQVRAIRSLLEKKNEYVALVVERYRRLFAKPRKLALARFVYSSRFPFLVAQVSLNVARTNDHFVRRGGELAGHCLNVTYDELCARPRGTLCRIVEFLGLRDGSGKDPAALVRPRPVDLLPEVAARSPRILARNLEYCRRFGV